MKDYYKILEVEENSTEEEIKKSYRSLSKKYHPDVNPDGVEKFKEINEAYEVLGDKEKRNNYNNSKNNPYAGTQFQDIFNSNDDRELFRYKFYIKNLYDDPLRKESHVDDDIADVRIEYKNNIYYYEISIYRLKMKNIDENNFTSEKMRKDIYHKGPLADNYFWDFLEFSYEVK